MRVQRITKKSTLDPLRKEPPDKRLLIWESETRGFGVRVTETGKVTFVFQYRDATGTSKRVTIGEFGQPWTVDMARDRAVDMQRAVAEGRDPREEKREARNALTIGEVVTRYLDEGPTDKPGKKASSWTTDRSNLTRHVMPLLGNRPARSVTKDDVARWLADVVEGKTATVERTGKARGVARVQGGPGTAARALAVFGAMMEWAHGKGIVPGNPVAEVKPPKAKKKDRFLSESEVSRLNRAMLSLVDDLDMLRPASADCFRLLMLTGCRKEEVASLRWEYIDLERGLLNLPDSKTGAKVVVLALPAVDMLAALRERRTEAPWVFPARRGDGPIGGLQKDWEMVREWAGVEGVRIHDLRHSFASFAAADGASLLLIGKTLGHRRAETTQRYAHLADDPVRQVANAAAGRIARALTSKSGERGGTRGTGGAPKGAPEKIFSRKHVSPLVMRASERYVVDTFKGD
ncbi:site-specific integrase [Roseospira goensis]|uniref:Integrase n=1 Tax=Roseospira goensis TaxID=391922 RepID=A0A7W6S345_9PROT|nr:site-specific integrase [Roseospira goensis]MBB4287515.1 integrase [Roseospira goensis]